MRVRPARTAPTASARRRVWRLGKKTLGLTVPARFAAGDPFHAGRVWDAMDVGLKAMAGVLAD